MINFRFHIVSLIAVFLALGLGILVGSTVIDQKIVNRLDAEIRRVDRENSSRKAAGAALSKENSRLRSLVDSAEPFVGDGRLEGFSIAILAERGLDHGSVKKAEDALRAAGADVPAIIWFDDSWQLDTDSRVQSLQSTLGLTGSATETRDAALDLLASRLVKIPPIRTTPTSTTRPRSSTSVGATTSTRPAVTSTTQPAVTVDAFAELEDAGFLSVTDGERSALNSFPIRESMVLVITGDDSHFLGRDLTASFARALVRAKEPALVAAVYDAGGDPANAPERGAAIAPVLDDRVLSRAVSTVDDLEQTEGRIAAVLALENVAGGNVGHYGYGTGASSPLPKHSS
jgi:Copper transport outer membrane protein, MctB